MTQANIDISTDNAKLDLLMIQRYLTETYWARGRTLQQVTTSVEQSVAFGLYLDCQQIAFARVLTDYVAIAYLLDVFVLPEYQNRRLGTTLVGYILAYPEFLHVDKWMLKSRDATSLYERHGFIMVDDPAGLMVLDRTLADTAE